MGAYLCIASNAVPPTVSKRIKVSVDCKYRIFSSAKCNEKFILLFFNKVKLLMKPARSA